MRKIKRLLSGKAIQNLRYFPGMVARIQTWFPFFLDYVGLDSNNRTYKFRNGIQISTHEIMDTATIGVIFLREDYGEIENRSVVLDVGANIGVFALYAATKSSHTTVYAYEPMPNNFSLLLANIQQNSLSDRIIPFPYGLAARREKRQLYVSDISVGHSLFQHNGEEAYVTIDCISLKDAFDDNKIEKCDLLKMDCEGAEFETLYSTPDEYLGRIKRIRMEYHDYSTNLSDDANSGELIRFLQNKGFQVMKLQQEEKNRGILWLERKEQVLA